MSRAVAVRLFFLRDRTWPGGHEPAASADKKPQERAAGFSDRRCHDEHAAKGLTMALQSSFLS